MCCCIVVGLYLLFVMHVFIALFMYVSCIYDLFSYLLFTILFVFICIPKQINTATTSAILWARDVAGAGSRQPTVGRQRGNLRADDAEFNALATAWDRGQVRTGDMVAWSAPGHPNLWTAESTVRVAMGGASHG